MSALEAEKMSNDELFDILNKHTEWLKSYKESGERGIISRFRFKDIELKNMNLTGIRAELTTWKNCTLKNCTFSTGFLDKSTFRNCNLMGSTFRNTSCVYTHFLDCNMQDTNFEGATMFDTSFEGSDMLGAKLGWGERPLTTHSIPMICPETGLFYGIKAAERNLVVLEIPADAQRLSDLKGYCRCDKAKVVGILNFLGDQVDVKEVRSIEDESVVYRIGEMVYPDFYDSNRWCEGSNGINFKMDTFSFLGKSINYTYFLDTRNKPCGE